MISRKNRAVRGISRLDSPTVNYFAQPSPWMSISGRSHTCIPFMADGEMHMAYHEEMLSFVLWATLK